MNKLIQISLIIISVYIIFGFFLFVTQKSLIYYPNEQNFFDCKGFLEYEKRTINDTRFYYLNKTDEVIIYYHANAGSACDRSYVKKTFEQFNTSLIFVEYSGYSNDTIAPNKQRIISNVQTIHSFIEKQEFSTVIIYGQSIGSGAASYHTHLGNVDSLILVTPFVSLTELVQSKYLLYPAQILLTETYPNNYWLQNYSHSLTILHGDSDNIIPHKFSQKLYNQSLSHDKNYYLIKNATHNNIWSFSSFQKQLTQSLNKTLSK